MSLQLEKSRSLPASLPFKGKLRIGKLSSKNLHMGMWYIYTLLYGHIKAALKRTKCTALGIAEIDCMLAAADVYGLKHCVHTILLCMFWQHRISMGESTLERL